MRIVHLIARIVTGCTHDHTYRERRILNGAPVMHLVCDYCGRAVPAVQRSASEHERVLQMGAVRMPHAHPQVAVEVVELVRPRRMSA
jgi:hypothetical protein